MWRPKISIITIGLNSEKTLARTIQSVLKQSYNNLEYIVVDGFSSDSSMKIAKSFVDPRLKVLQRHDAGISDALNQAIAETSGEVIGIIHSDDFYLPNAAELSVSALLETGRSWSYGQLEYIDKVGTLHYRSGKSDAHQSLKNFMAIPHPTVFAKKTLYQRAGGFDTKLRYAMDYDLIIRFLHSGAPAFVPHVIAKMQLGGTTSSSYQAEVRTALEALQVKNRHFRSRKIINYVYFMWSQTKIFGKRALIAIPFLRSTVPQLRKFFNPLVSR